MRYEEEYEKLNLIKMNKSLINMQFRLSKSKHKHQTIFFVKTGLTGN